MGLNGDEGDIFSGIDYGPREEVVREEEGDIFSGIDYGPRREEEEEEDITPVEKKPSLYERGLEKGKEFVTGLPRRISRYAQRGAETALGAPGDVVQTVRGLASIMPGGIKPEEELNFLQRGGRKLLEALPGSAELRARSAEMRPELEPVGEFEKAEDETIEDFTRLAMPIGGQMAPFKAFGLSLIGNVGKQAVKALGVGETGQEVTKLGTTLFGGLFGKGRGIKTYISKLYKNAEFTVPKGAKFKYNMKGLKTVSSTLQKGIMNEDKQAALDVIKEVKAKVPKGIMTVENAVQVDKDINKAIRKTYDSDRLRYLHQIHDAHTTEMATYAKENPSWGDYYKEAKLAYAGMKAGRAAKDFIKRNAKVPTALHALAILGIEEMAIPGHAKVKIGALGITAATLYAAEVARRIAFNPALRRYYQNVIGASLSENKLMLTRNLAGLERAAKKEFEENPIPLSIFQFEEDEEGEED